MINSKRKIIANIIVDTLNMSTGDQLEWIISNPEATKAKNSLPDAIRLIVKGKVRLDLGSDFSKILVVGDQTDNNRPKESAGGYTSSLTVTYTALEDSIYLCAAKTGTIATRTFITTDSSGTVNVPAQTLVIPTALTTIDNSNIYVGDVYFAENQTTLTTEPGSVIALTQFN